jgi:hypothetical protein
MNQPTFGPEDDNMAHKISTMALLITTLCAGAAQAGTLVVIPSDERLTAESWQYREVSSRGWWWGIPCWQWDVLQGTGWFRGTWRETIEPLCEEGEYIFETNIQGWARHCRAQMDQYNRVRLVYETKEGDVFVGGFSLIPDGTSDEAEIRCSVTNPESLYNSLTCEDAHVAWSTNAEVWVSVIME